jgi:hypothetical protein
MVGDDYVTMLGGRGPCEVYQEHWNFSFPGQQGR